MRHLIIVFILSSVLFACNNAKAPEAANFKSSAQAIESKAMYAAPAPIEASAAPENPSTNATGEPIPAQPQTAPSTVQKKIIKDGTMRIKTADMPAAKKRFDALLKSLNAYYELEDLQNNDAEIRYELKIRIP